MRKITDNERKQIERDIAETISYSISSDYVCSILDNKDGWTENSIMEDIVDDILTLSAWEDEGYYNEDDIRLAIGRVLMDRLGIDM